MKHQIRFTHREYIGTEFETQFQSVLPYGQNSATVLFTVQCNLQFEHSSVYFVARQIKTTRKIPTVNC